MRPFRDLRTHTMLRDGWRAQRNCLVLIGTFDPDTATQAMIPGGKYLEGVSQFVEAILRAKNIDLDLIIVERPNLCNVINGSRLVS